MSCKGATRFITLFNGSLGDGYLLPLFNYLNFLLQWGLITQHDHDLIVQMHLYTQNTGLQKLLSCG